jgi:hypothetical protein
MMGWHRMALPLLWPGQAFLPPSLKEGKWGRAYRVGRNEAREAMVGQGAYIPDRLALSDSLLAGFVCDAIESRGPGLLAPLASFSCLADEGKAFGRSLALLWLHRLLHGNQSSTNPASQHLHSLFIEEHHRNYERPSGLPRH